MPIFLGNLQVIHLTGMQAGSRTVVPSLARLHFPLDLHGALGKSQERISSNSDREGGEARAEAREEGDSGIKIINEVLATQNMQREVRIFRTMIR